MGRAGLTRTARTSIQYLCSFQCACVRCTLDDDAMDPLEPYFCRRARCSLTFKADADTNQRRCAVCGVTQTLNHADDDEEGDDSSSADRTKGTLM